jgi:hypothetical protein
MDNLQIRHFPAKEEFRAELPATDGKKSAFALLQYQQIDAGIYDLYHTEGNTISSLWLLEQCSML